VRRSRFSDESLVAVQPHQHGAVVELRPPAAPGIVGAVARIRLIGLQILVFPFEASSTGLGDEPNPAFPVNNLPMLRDVVEFDGAGPSDFEPPEFI